MLISRIVHKLQKISQRQQERAPCPHPFCIQQAPILWPKVVFHVFVFYAHWVLQNIQIDSVIAFKMSNFFKIVVAMGLGLTQVKCRLLISSIFYLMNFRHSPYYSILENFNKNYWLLVTPLPPFQNANEGS